MSVPTATPAVAALGRDDGRYDWKFEVGVLEHFPPNGPRFGDKEMRQAKILQRIPPT